MRRCRLQRAVRYTWFTRVESYVMLEEDDIDPKLSPGAHLRDVIHTPYRNTPSTMYIPTLRSAWCAYMRGDACIFIAKNHVLNPGLPGLQITRVPGLRTDTKHTKGLEMACSSLMVQAWSRSSPLYPLLRCLTLSLSELTCIMRRWLARGTSLMVSTRQNRLKALTLSTRCCFEASSHESDNHKRGKHSHGTAERGGAAKLLQSWPCRLAACFRRLTPTNPQTRYEVQQYATLHAGAFAFYLPPAVAGGANVLPSPAADGGAATPLLAIASSSDAEDLVLVLVLVVVVVVAPDVEPTEHRLVWLSTISDGRARQKK